MRHTPIIRLLPLLLAALLAFTGCGNDSNGSSSDADLSAIHREVKALYGEGYYPSLAIDNDTLSRKYGLTREKMDEVIAEEAALSEHPDTFIAVKAKKGEADALEEELAAYQGRPRVPRQPQGPGRPGGAGGRLSLLPGPGARARRRGLPHRRPGERPRGDRQRGGRCHRPAQALVPPLPSLLFRAPSPRPPAAGFFCPLSPSSLKIPGQRDLFPPLLSRFCTKSVQKRPAVHTNGLKGFRAPSQKRPQTISRRNNP